MVRILQPILDIWLLSLLVFATNHQTPHPKFRGCLDRDTAHYGERFVHEESAHFFEDLLKQTSLKLYRFDVRALALRRAR